MNFISSVSNITAGIIELFSLIICIDFLCIVRRDEIKKSMLIPCLITYFGISTLWLFLINIFDNLMGPVGLLLYYMRLILSMGILYGRINLKIVYLTALFDLSISLIKSNASYILARALGISFDEISPFTMIVIQLVVLFFILVVKKKSSNQINISMLATIPRSIYIMLILAILCLSGLSSLISFPTDNIAMKENILIAIVVILTIILVCIVVSLFLNVIGKQHFTAVSQMMEKQVELQINHYKELEKIDAEINRFRHDYSNHLQSILSLVQMNECSLAEEYILKLKKVKYKSDIHIFYTGNRLADAILSDKSSVLSENCRIEYSGIIPLSIENVDLCIILSNLLDNALEACQELSQPTIISMYAREQQGYFVLSMKNPTSCCGNYYSIPATTKPDKNQHGMGLYNVENIVKKYDGQMKIKCQNGLFEVMITMKI